MKRYWKIILLGGVICVILLYSILNLVTGSILRKTLAEMQAEGMPMTLEEIVPPAPDEADNAAGPLTEAFLGLSNGEGGGAEGYSFVEEVTDVLDDITFTGEASVFALNKEKLAALEEAMKAPIFVENLALLEQAAERPACDFGLDYGLGPSLLLPHLSPIRHSVRLLGIRAALLSANGDFAAAVEDVERMLRISRHLQQERTLISYLVLVACDGISVACLNGVIAQCDVALPEAEVTRLQAELDWHRRHTNALLQDTIHGERILFGGWCFEGLLSGKFGDKELDEAMAGDGHFATLAKLPIKPLFKLDYNAYLKIMRQCHKKSQLSYPELVAAPETPLPPRYCIFSRMIVPSLDSVGKRSGQHESSLRIAQIGLSLHTHRHATGAYPETLQELGDAIINPITLKPYTYSSSGSDYQLYSFGLDGKRGRPNQADDTIWRLTDSQE
ncbi:MAG: hypothetical protein ACI8W8_001191 [Rhodothermales bacterium]|jgi:hypothetical protein